MGEYRVGKSWHRHTIVLEGVLPADEQGRREDDRPVAFVDSAAPEGLAAQICALLNDPPCTLFDPEGRCECHKLSTCLNRRLGMTTDGPPDPPSSPVSAQEPPVGGIGGPGGSGTPESVYAEALDDIERLLDEYRGPKALRDGVRAVVARVRVARGDVVHLCPDDNSGVTSCCARTPYELPRMDRITEDPNAATCPGWRGVAL